MALLYVLCLHFVVLFEEILPEREIRLKEKHKINTWDVYLKK